MSLKAKGLLSLMLSLPDDWNYSIAGLVTLSKDGKDSVMSALAELEKFGYLKRTRLTNEKGQFQGVEYDIFEEPQAEIPVAAKQNEDNQHEDKANAGDQPQLNTNSIKDLSNQDIKESNTNMEEFETILSTSVVNLSLRELYKDYIEMRESIDSPLTRQGLRALIKRCEKLSNFNLEMQKSLLEAAIINNWKNVYSPRANDAPQDVRDDRLYQRLAEVYGMSD